jgi:hypothetical protein
MPKKYVNKQRRFGENARKSILDFTLLFMRAFPSHGRGRRFNPCSAHQPSPLRGYGWQAASKILRACSHFLALMR